MREDCAEIVAGGREDRRSFGAQKGSDMSESLGPTCRRVDGILPRSPV